jgi:hypothetical protein
MSTFVRICGISASARVPLDPGPWDEALPTSARGIYSVSPAILHGVRFCTANPQVSASFSSYLIQCMALLGDLSASFVDNAQIQVKPFERTFIGEGVPSTMSRKFLN